MSNSALVDTADNPALGSATQKVFRHVIPIFCAMYLLNCIDRVNIGFVATHLKVDVGIGAAAFGFGAGLFFIGYSLMEVPANMLLQRWGARAWLTRILLTWGLAAAAMAFIQNEMHFYILRFLLGIAEAGFFPGVIYYLSRWLPAAERGKATALFLSSSAIASILSGPISGGLLQLSGFGLHGWQWMFIVEGTASVLFTAIVWFFLKSHPEDAPWLTREEKDALSDDLEREQASREQERGGHASAWALLRDKNIVLFCVVYFVAQLTIYAATFWLPSMIRNMGLQNDFQVGLLNSVPWILSILGMYGIAAGARKFGHQRLWVALAFTIAAGGLFLSTQGGPVVAYVSICLAAIGFKASVSSFWPIPQTYLDARIAAAVIAVISAIGNLGGFVAPTTFGLGVQLIIG